MAIHHTKVAKAKKLIGDTTDVEQITKTLLENQFTDEEVGEILQKLQADGGEVNNQSVPPPENKEPAKEQKAKVSGYEEWRGEIKIERGADGKEISRRFEKLKKLRDNVKITDDEAEFHNQGMLDSPRQDYVIMYLKPE